jgi:hypothetical protein
VVSVVAASCATSEDGLEERIAAAAASHGCVALGASPGDSELSAWFVDLAPYTGGAGDVAFLCRAQSEERTLLLIVDAKSPKSPWRGCGSRVSLDTLFEPEGITVVEPGQAPRLAQIPLDEWEDLSGKAGPAGVTPASPILDTSEGIAGWAFYCHDGRWLTAFVH